MERSGAKSNNSSGSNGNAHFTRISINNSNFANSSNSSNNSSSRGGQQLQQKNNRFKEIKSPVHPSAGPRDCPSDPRPLGGHHPVAGPPQRAAEVEALGEAAAGHQNGATVAGGQEERLLPPPPPGEQGRKETCQEAEGGRHVQVQHGVAERPEAEADVQRHAHKKSGEEETWRGFPFL